MAVEPTSADFRLETFVRRLRLHSILSEADAAAVRSLAYGLIKLRPHSQLVREGDHTQRCAVVLSGFMHRYRLTNEGERQILTIYLPGDPIDFDHLFLPVADDSLQAVRECTLASVAQDDLRRLIEDRPAIAEAIIRTLLVDASIFREWILNVGRRDARTRIAHLLCEISTRLQAQHFDFRKTPLPLTQDQIADATGLTSVHVNRVLKAMSAERLIERRGALVMLPDAGALRAVAGFDDRYLHLRR